MLFRSGDIKKTLDAINGTLELCGARGRRKNVRANCLHDNESYILWTQDNKMHELKMADISTVGAALVVPPKANYNVQAKTILNGATIKFGAKQYIIDVAIFAIHERGNAKLLITMFKPDTVTELIRSSIRDYIVHTLQTEIQLEINNEKPDNRDYLKEGKFLQDALRVEISAKAEEEKSKAKGKDGSDAKKA